MQCADAYLLLEQGVAPGSSDLVRTTLGFHLAQCPVCRKYRTQFETQRLLQTLFAEPMSSPIGPGLALRPPRPGRPMLRYQHRFGAALLIVGALATVSLSYNTPVRATTFAAQTAPQNLAQAAVLHVQPAPPVAVHAQKPAAVETVRSGSRLPLGQLPDQDLVLKKLLFSTHTFSERARPASMEATEWAAFAPASAVDSARSQLIAFEKAGPQELPPQVLQLEVDDSFANMPLEAGQTLFLPEEPPAPPEPPPPAVFVSADTLPPLPAEAVPAAQRPTQARPAAPKPIPSPPVAQTGRQYVVKPGDTLTTIALRYYGSEARWRSIYNANRNLIGSNPNLIRPNQQLVIPALQTQSSNTKPSPSAPSQRTYTVRSGDTLSAIALEFYGDGNLWPLLYSANRGTIGADPDLIFPQQRLAVPQRTETNGTGNPSKTSSLTAQVKATGKLTYTVAKGDSLRGLAKRVYNNESRWKEIYTANRSLIPDPDRLQIGIQLVIP